MRCTKTVTCLTAAGALAAGMLSGLSPARASAACEDNIGYRVSVPSPDYHETGEHTVVIGLSALTRSVTFYAKEGCVLEDGETWSVVTPYFRTGNTYDGTPESVTTSVRVAVPRYDRAVGPRPAVVTLNDGAGAESDTVSETTLYVKRRTEIRGFNAYVESPTPRCGLTHGTILHAKARLTRASWTARAYLPYGGRTVRLLSSPGHTAEHNLEDSVVASDVTGPKGWGYYSFRPPYDARYQAHVGNTSTSGHSDSGQDFVDCRR